MSNVIDQETVLAVAFYDGNECEGGLTWEESVAAIVEARRYLAYSQCVNYTQQKIVLGRGYEIDSMGMPEELYGKGKNENTFSMYSSASSNIKAKGGVFSAELTSFTSDM